VKFQFKYDINIACRVVLQEHLDGIGVPYEIIGMAEVQFNGPVPPEQFRECELSLKKYGIEIIDDPKTAIVQKIKELIKELVYLEEKPDNSKISAYIAERMNLSYSHLSKIFSEVTYTTVENFFVLQRVERVKQLIIEEKLTCTEVAWKMNYSSVAHLSNQFKKTTGLTPKAFQTIIERRNNLESSSSQSETQ
jgi:AraC-like DNA-binding protein